MTRNKEMVFELLKNFANQDKNILALILNGSRANPNEKDDGFQDYDISCISSDFSHYIDNKNWISRFGKILIKQEPDAMDNSWPDNQNRYTFLMLFKDGVRIDLTFYKQDYFDNFYTDSLSKILLDKFNLYTAISKANDSSYLPKKPTQQEFDNCVNEFFWVSNSVAKGLAREQFLYSSLLLEKILRSELLKMLSFYAAENTNYNKNFGSYYKYLDKYLSKEIWQEYLNTYSKADIKSLNQIFIKMCDLFYKVAKEFSNNIKFQFNDKEARQVLEYVQNIKSYR